MRPPHNLAIKCPPGTTDDTSARATRSHRGRVCFELRNNSSSNNNNNNNNNNNRSIDRSARQPRRLSADAPPHLGANAAVANVALFTKRKFVVVVVVGILSFNAARRQVVATVIYFLGCAIARSLNSLAVRSGSLPVRASTPTKRRRETLANGW